MSDLSADYVRCRWCEKSIVPFKGMYGSQWIHEGTWRAECEPWHVAEPARQEARTDG